MNKTLAFLSLALASSASWATYCPDGSTIESHPNGNCNYTPPKPPGFEGVKVEVSPNASSDAQAKAAAQSSASIKASQSTAVSNRQQQGQQQQQAQRQSLNNTNANQSAGGSVVIEGNQAGSGDRSSFVAWAPVLHGPAAPALASANLVVVPGVCGPRVRVITSQIVGQHYGPMGGRYDEQRGYMETLGPWLDEDGNPGKPFVWRDGFMLGHVVTQYAAVVGTSSAASFSVGGFVDSKGLQGGAAGSGAAQQLVKSVQVTDCVYATPAPAVTVFPAPFVKQRAKKVRTALRRPVGVDCGCKKGG